MCDEALIKGKVLEAFRREALRVAVNEMRVLGVLPAGSSAYATLRAARNVRFKYVDEYREVCEYAGEHEIVGVEVDDAFFCCGAEIYVLVAFDDGRKLPLKVVVTGGDVDQDLFAKYKSEFEEKYGHARDTLA